MHATSRRVSRPSQFPPNSARQATPVSRSIELVVVGSTTSDIFGESAATLVTLCCNRFFQRHQQELSCQESNAVLHLFSTSSSPRRVSLLLAHWRPFKVVVVVVVFLQNAPFSPAVTITNISSEIEIVQKRCDSNEVPPSAKYRNICFCWLWLIVAHQALPTSKS